MKQFSIRALVVFAIMIGLSGRFAEASSSEEPKEKENSNSMTIAGLTTDKKTQISNKK